jgi:hypothetical protein
MLSSGCFSADFAVVPTLSRHDFPFPSHVKTLKAE